MSVPVGKRKPKLQVFIKAQALYEYVFKITSNEKIFKQVYLPLIKKVNETAMNIYINLWTANNIKVENDILVAERKKYTSLALTNCKTLLALIEMCYHTFKLSGKRIIYWTRLVEEEIILIKGFDKVANKN